MTIWAWFLDKDEWLEFQQGASFLRYEFKFVSLAPKSEHKSLKSLFERQEPIQLDFLRHVSMILFETLKSNCLASFSVIGLLNRACTSDCAPQKWSSLHLRSRAKSDFVLIPASFRPRIRIHSENSNLAATKDRPEEWNYWSVPPHLIPNLQTTCCLIPRRHVFFHPTQFHRLFLST